jgi:hypothetical protein
MSAIDSETVIEHYQIVNGPLVGSTLLPHELGDTVSGYRLRLEEVTVRNYYLLDEQGARRQDYTSVSEHGQLCYLRIEDKLYLAGMASYCERDYSVERRSYIVVCDDPKALVAQFIRYGWNAYEVPGGWPSHELVVDFIPACKLRSICEGHAPEAVWDDLDND